MNTQTPDITSKQSFADFLTGQTVHIPVADFLINIVLAALLAHLLSLIYLRYAQTLSNKKKLSKNFILITMTTMLIITIVKSSLALSLPHRTNSGPVQVRRD